MGIAGVGAAKHEMLAVRRHPRLQLAAAADVDGQLLHSTTREYGISGFASVTELCRSDAVDAVYIGTPTRLHVEHALTAIDAGKHLIVAKPMALNLTDAVRIVEAAQHASVQLLVGHTQSFEPAILEMRRLIASGELGPLRLINTSYYTDWIYRGRKPDELQTALGGGVVYRQGAHQFDVIRLLGGGLLRSIRALAFRWDPERPTEGAYAAFLEFQDGAAATAVFNGYDHLHSTDLGFPIGEGGRRVDNRSYGSARGALTASVADEEALKTLRRARDASVIDERHHSFYGLTIASCERGDIRQSPGGLLVYSDDRAREIALPADRDGRDLMMDELAAAVLDGQPPQHSGGWGMATLEVQLAVLKSATDRREIQLSHQVPLTGSASR